MWMTWTNGKQERSLLKRILTIVLITLFCSTLSHNALTAPGDLILPREGGGEMDLSMTPESIFPHWVHRARYRCDTCHDALFKMELGATEITMDLMDKNESCAVCHNGEIAFAVGLNTCNRCHITQTE